MDPVAVKEVIYQVAAYLGVGRTYDFLTAANEIMKQHGICLPLPSQATVNEENNAPWNVCLTFDNDILVWQLLLFAAIDSIEKMRKTELCIVKFVGV